MFAPGVLDRHYQMLIQCDKRLFELSKKSFPTVNVPCFYSSLVNDLQVPPPAANGNINGEHTQIPNHVPEFSVPSIPPQLVHNYNNGTSTSTAPLIIEDSSLPILGKNNLLYHLSFHALLSEIYIYTLK